MKKYFVILLVLHLSFSNIFFALRVEATTANVQGVVGGTTAPTNPSSISTFSFPKALPQVPASVPTTLLKTGFPLNPGAITPLKLPRVQSVPSTFTAPTSPSLQLQSNASQQKVGSPCTFFNPNGTTRPGKTLLIGGKSSCVVLK